jgi:hypothetical protein
MKKIFVLLMLVLTSCASKDLALKADLVESTNPVNMDVTAEVIEDYSDAYNLLLQINFRSHDGRWIRVDSVEFDASSSENDPFNVIVGKDLVTWAQAKAEERRMEIHNDDMATLGLTATGGALAVMGILSNSKELTAIGTAVTVGGLGHGAYKELSGDQKNAQGVAMVPESHLYSPFAVPSMSLAKRWVLINSPNGKINRIAKLKLKTVEGDVLKYNLALTR